MKIIKTTGFPPGSYKAITIGPWIFTKSDLLTESDIQHESIHWEQQKETLILGFFVLYVVFFVVELIRCAADSSRGAVEGRKRSLWKRAYRSNPFEREAYAHESEPGYLESRPTWAWIKA